MALSLMAFGCASPPGDGTPSFEHELADGPTPWSHEQFDVGEDDFTFAIIGDLTGGERSKTAAGE